MAVVFSNDTTKRTSTLVADYPENILLDPQLNGRIETTDVEDLAADIEKNGQRTPVLVRKNDAGLPVLVYGHRRWRAVKLINSRLAKKGEALIKLECTYETLTDEEAFAAAIAENRFRKDTTPMDDTHNIGIWQKRFKKSLEEIAAIYFPEAKKPEEKVTALKWVKDRAALVELAPEAAAAVREGKVKITAAVQLTRLSKDKQKEVIAQTQNTLKGKTRIKVSNVIAAKKKGASKAESSKTAPAPAKPVAPPKVTSSVYEAAETLARAVDTWLEGATPVAEKALVAAHKQYRALVPFRKAEGKAA
jgi:ParB-like chromosome segregation protein Spo0J